MHLIDFHFSIETDNNGNATAHVSYEVVFDPDEVPRARYTERVTLVGDDRNELRAPWDPEIQELRDVPALLEEEVRATEEHIIRSLTSQPFDQDLLQEDLGPDEIAVRIEFRPENPDVFRGRTMFSRPHTSG